MSEPVPEPSPEDVNTSTLTIFGSSRLMTRPEGGTDTMILSVPDELVAAPPASVGTNPRLGLFLALKARQMADLMGEQLRMSGWWITRDPAVVEQRGLIHDCDVCRAGVAEAVRLMKDRPEIVIAVGVLSFAARGST